MPGGAAGLFHPQILRRSQKHYRVGRGHSSASLVDWGGTNKKKMNPFVTVDAFHVLKAADQLDVFIW